MSSSYDALLVKEDDHEDSFCRVVLLTRIFCIVYFFKELEDDVKTHFIFRAANHGFSSI